MGSGGSFLEGKLVKQEWFARDRIGAVKLLETTRGSRSLPPKSNSPNSIYAIKTKDGKLKQVAFYGKSRNIAAWIDFDHAHNGIKPHFQYADKKTGKRIYRPLNVVEEGWVRRLSKWDV